MECWSIITWEKLWPVQILLLQWWQALPSSFLRSTNKRANISFLPFSPGSQTAALIARESSGGWQITFGCWESEQLLTPASLSDFFIYFLLHQGNRDNSMLCVMSALECPCQSKGGGVLRDSSCWLHGFIGRRVETWPSFKNTKNNFKNRFRWLFRALLLAVLFQSTGTRPHPLACTCRLACFQLTVGTATPCHSSASDWLRWAWHWWWMPWQRRRWGSSSRTSDGSSLRGELKEMWEADKHKWRT